MHATRTRRRPATQGRGAGPVSARKTPADRDLTRLLCDQPDEQRILWIPEKSHCRTVAGIEKHTIGLRHRFQCLGERLVERPLYRKLLKN